MIFPVGMRRSIPLNETLYREIHLWGIKKPATGAAMAGWGGIDGIVVVHGLSESGEFPVSEPSAPPILPIR